MLQAFVWRAMSMTHFCVQMCDVRLCCFVSAFALDFVVVVVVVVVVVEDVGDVAVVVVFVEGGGGVVARAVAAVPARRPRPFRRG